MDAMPVRARVALGVLVSIGLAAVLSPLVLRFGPNDVLGLDHLRSLPPSWQHPLGTDENSRDMLARLMAGARVSLAFGVLSAVIAAALGASTGILAAIARPWVGQLLMRTVDLGLAVPRLLLLIVLTAAFGRLPWGWLAVAMGATSWFSLARLVRGEALTLASGDFTAAARALGAGTTRIAARHILPNVAGSIAAATVLAFAHSITLETALSFIGQGVAIPTASWGGLLNEGRAQVAVAPWLTVMPALAIVVTVLAAGALAEGVERGTPWQRTDPRA